MKAVLIALLVCASVYVLWLIAKRAIAMRLFGLKASALQEATMEVHSVERAGDEVVIELTIAPSFV